MPLRVFCLILSLLLLASCMTHERAVAKVKTGLSTGQPVDITYFSQKLEGKDRLLMLMERGRARQLSGAYQESSADYLEAIRYFEQLEDKARVTLTGSLAQAGAIITNDNVIPYSGESFERIILHQLDAFNRLAAGELDYVGVNVRNAAYCLDREVERHNKEMEKVKTERQKQSELPTVTDQAGYRQNMASGEALAATIKNSFQNAYVYYLAGVWHESQQEWGNAYIAYKRALELCPESVQIRADAARMGVRNGIEATELAALGGEPPPTQPGTDVIVFFEEDYICPKDSFYLPIPIFTGNGLILIPVAFPYYNVSHEQPAAVQVLDAEGRLLRTGDLLCDFRALAVKALQERMPAIIVRQAVRATVKGLGVAAARRADSFVGLAAQVYTLASEAADTRCWQLLPRYAHVVRVTLPPGPQSLTLQHAVYPPRQMRLELDCTAGGIIVVHAMSIPGKLHVNAARLK